MKRAIKNRRGEGYIRIAFLVLFLSLLTSVLLLYLGLCGQVLNERRERKQALDSYLAEFTKASYDAIRQGDGYADAIDYDKLVDGCPSAIGVTDAEVTLERGNGFGLTVSYTLKIPVTWNGRTFGTLSVPMRVSSFYEEKYKTLGFAQTRLGDFLEEVP